MIRCAICDAECEPDSVLVESGGEFSDPTNPLYIRDPYIAPNQTRVRSRWFNAAENVDFCSPEHSLKWERLQGRSRGRQVFV